MDAAFLSARIDATKAQIVAYEAAILALASGGVQEYALDTGQSSQRVTKLDLDKLQSVLDALMNRLDVLTQRACGTAANLGVPGF